MYRKSSISVREWLENSNKALLVMDARQTEKTWLIRMKLKRAGIISLK
mgnify:CR=1 FL=1